MLGRCCSASCAPRCAPRPFVSLAAAARHQQHKQLRPCGGAQHRPATATVVAAASRGGSGTGSGRGRNPGQRPGPPPAGSGINAKQLNSQISGCLDADVLMQLVKQHAASFDYIHASTALFCAANLMQPPLSADEQACVRQLVQLASVRLADCGSQALANMTWALAKLEYGDKAFLQQLAQQSQRILPQFKPQEVVNALWALAKLGHEDRAFAKRLLEHARCKLPDFNPQDVANLLLAMAKLQHVVQDILLVQQALHCAKGQLPQFNSQATCNTAWALATLRFYDQGFMEQLLQHAEHELPSFNQQHVSNILWAIATLDHQDPGFVNSAVKRLLLLDRMKDERQALCNSVWALSVLQHDAMPVVAPLVAAVFAAFPALLVPADDARLGDQLRQIHQYLVTMEGAGRIPQHLRASPQYMRLRRATQAVFCQRTEELRGRRHRLNVALLQAVKQLPGCGAAEAMPLAGDHDVAADVGVALSCGTKVAVQAEMLTAYMINEPDKALGPVLWRRQQLAARGYKVVVVTESGWQEWGPEGQQMYLQLQFRGAGVVLPTK